MANELTGDFDVVAEFSLGAVNRVLAAMHSANRFPHSWSLRVDDTPHSKRVVRSQVDVFGDPVIAPVTSANALAPKLGPGRSASDPLFQNVDLAVNLGAQQPTVSDPHHLTGFAQVQFGPPTLTVPNDSGAAVISHTPMMARYISDLGSMPMPDYLRGEVQVTLAADEGPSQPGQFIEVTLSGPSGNIGFVPYWSNTPLSNEQKAAINKALRNSLANSFQPSSTPLPEGIVNMRFKAMPQASQALAVLMNLPGGAYATALAGELLGEALGLTGTVPNPDPAAVNDLFLSDGDDFAFAVSNDFIQRLIAPALNDVESQTLQFAFDMVILFSKTRIVYTVSINSLDVALQDGAGGYPKGRILVTFSGSANTTSDFPDVDFDGSQGLVLEITSSGDSADIAPDGDPYVNLHAPGVLPDWVVNQLLQPTAQALVRKIVQSWLNQINPGIADNLSNQQKLGTFLTPLINPSPKAGTQPEQPVKPQLAYTDWEIRSTGLILHGRLQVPEWPRVLVYFDSRPVTFSSGRALASWIEYNALKSWIPGGTIREFVWNVQNGPQLLDDFNTFLLLNARSAISHLCLTIKGTRIPASGPTDPPEYVSSTLCMWTIPSNSYAGGLAKATAAGRPKVALVQPTKSGFFGVVGHTLPWAPDGSPPHNNSNLIVHFPDHRSHAHLDILTHGLKKSERNDAAAGIVVVLNADQLKKTRAVDGLMFADDDQAWAQLLKAKRRPETFVLGVSGETTWHHHGQITSSELAEALRTHLVGGGNSLPNLLQSRVRVGWPTPNFLFESAPGHQLTLRKLVGRRVVLVFWISSSHASLETVLDLQRALSSAGDQAPVILAINDGETPAIALRVAKKNGLSAIVVPDPRRDIATAYDVSIWPTSIFLDEQGLVSDIRYGRFAGELAKSPRSKTER